MPVDDLRRKPIIFVNTLGYGSGSGFRINSTRDVNTVIRILSPASNSCSLAPGYLTMYATMVVRFLEGVNIYDAAIAY